MPAPQPNAAETQLPRGKDEDCGKLQHTWHVDLSNARLSYCGKCGKVRRGRKQGPNA